MNNTQRARILNPEDVITDDVHTIIEGPDYKGNYLLLNETTQKRTRQHPTRILKINEEGVAVYRHNDTEMRADCPDCKCPQTVEIPQETIQCPEHGKWTINWGTIESGPRPASADAGKKMATSRPLKSKTKSAAKKSIGRSKSPMAIDFEAMKQAGELWTKTGVDFDYVQYEVKAHVLIIDDGVNSRKMCFNSYNGTWGKKSKDEDLALFISDQRAPGSKTIGYYIKVGVENERRKLERSGYVKA
jgi:uncharacterized Zn finger protein (UPF0148 family)